MQVELNGTNEIGRPPADVYARLMDPTFVAGCAPGVDRVVTNGDDRFDVRARFGVGVIRVKLKVEVEITERRTDEHASLVFIGKGAGTEVRGTTTADLTETGRGTTLAWNGVAEVHGLLARVGARLLRSQTEKTVADFWETFAGRVEGAA